MLSPAKNYIRPTRNTGSHCRQNISYKNALAKKAISTDRQTDARTDRQKHKNVHRIVKSQNKYSECSDIRRF